MLNRGTISLAADRIYLIVAFGTCEFDILIDCCTVYIYIFEPAIIFVCVCVYVFNRIDEGINLSIILIWFFARNQFESFSIKFGCLSRPKSGMNIIEEKSEFVWFSFSEQHSFPRRNIILFVLIVDLICFISLSLFILICSNLFCYLQTRFFYSSIQFRFS